MEFQTITRTPHGWVRIRDAAQVGRVHDTPEAALCGFFMAPLYVAEPYEMLRFTRAVLQHVADSRGAVAEYWAARNAAVCGSAGAANFIYHMLWQKSILLIAGQEAVLTEFSRKLLDDMNMLFEAEEKEDKE
jgi:hypothetical protein